MTDWSILAETAEPVIREVQGWLQVVTNLGFGGLVWYLLAVALPKMQERFDSHTDRQQKAFIEESEKLREAHAHTIASIISQHENQQERIVRLLETRQSRQA